MTKYIAVIALALTASLTSGQTDITPPSTGGVTTLSLTTPNLLYTSPVTFSATGTDWTGTLALIPQSANLVLAGPTSGGSATPTFRALVAADIPSAIARSGANTDITSISTLTSFGTGSTATLFNSSGVLQIGGVTSASPGIKKSGTQLQARLADDSNYADFRAASFTFSILNESNSTLRLRYDGTGGRIELDNAGKLTWSSTSNYSGSADLGLGRNAAGVLEINNGTAGTYRDAKFRHIIGGSTAPTIANGAGAGTSPGTPTLTGSDAAGQITIITGTLPSISAVAVTVTFNAAYGTAPYVVIWPANANAATLGFLPYVGSTTTTFTVNAGTVALGASTTYIYNYVVVQ